MFQTIKLPENDFILASNEAFVDSHLIKDHRQRSAARDTVLEALVSETQYAALLTAAVTSWVNAMDRDEVAAKARLAHAFLPPDPGFMLTMRRWLRTTHLDAETINCVNAFLSALPDARRAFASFRQDGVALGFSHAAILHQGHLQDIWRMLCSRALMALAKLNLRLSDQLPDVYLRNGRAIYVLILTARNGQSPCLEQNGQIYLPVTPQRRRSVRRALRENCEVRLGLWRYQCFALDISASGIGIERTPYLDVGAAVSVVLSVGRVLQGRVAWSRRQSAGVQFKDKLKPNDPLLAG